MRGGGGLTRAHRLVVTVAIGSSPRSRLWESTTPQITRHIVLIELLIAGASAHRAAHRAFGFVSQAYQAYASLLGVSRR